MGSSYDKTVGLVIEGSKNCSLYELFQAQEDRAMKVITESYYELGRMSLHEIQVIFIN